MKEFESFHKETTEINGVIYISIPWQLVKFAGIKKGDMLKVMIKKIGD